MLKWIKRIILLAGLVFAIHQVMTIRESVHRVLQYKQMVEHSLSESHIRGNVDLVLTMIYTETKGGQVDVMQSSESESGETGSITDSQSSIESGVALLSHNLVLAQEAGVDFWTAVQAYNFGTAYINYVANNGGENTLELAKTYSKDVVAPSLGNHSGETYFYYHPLALVSGGKLYKNGGNIYYSREVHFNLYLIELMNLF